MKIILCRFLLIILISIVTNTKSYQQSITEPYDQRGAAIAVAYKFIKVINEGNRDSIRVFILNTYDENVFSRIPIWLIETYNMAVYLESGGFGYEIREVTTTDAGLITLKVLNRLSDCYVNIRIPTAGAPDYKISNLVTSENSLSKIEDWKEPDHIELVKRLDELFRLIELEREFSGVILVAKNDSVLVNKVIGMASISYGVPNQSNTRFNIASVGKMFTAAAIAKLVNEGKISYDDTISRYISSDWLNPEVSKQIQIKHLVTHTSGLGDYFFKVSRQCEVPYFRELDDYKPLVVNDSLMFEPGSRFSYSNTGLLFAGVIVENVSKESYFSYLRKNIFLPLGMRDTDGFDKDFPAPNTATGYTKIIQKDGEVKWNNNQFTRIMRGSPSGGIYSTAEDLWKFAQAIRDNKLFSPEYQQMLLTSRPELNVSFHGYLFFNSGDENDFQVSHSGDGQGTNCYFKMFLNSGYTYIILSNMNRPSALIVANVLDQLLTKSRTDRTN